MVTGEVRTQAYVDVPGIAREVLREIGYDRYASEMNLSGRQTIRK